MESVPEASLKTIGAYSARRIRTFSPLPDEVIGDLDGMIIPAPRTSGAILYSQGDKPSSLYVLFTGRVKLTTVVANRKTAVLRIAESGEFLGLHAVMTRGAYVATARVMEDSRIAFIPREGLMNLMGRCPQLAIAIAERLARDCADALSKMVFLRVTTSTAQRLATLILRWSIANRNHNDGIPLIYTQAEIGQMIGASRETVTRLINRLERKGDIQVSDSNLKIVDYAALEEIAQLRRKEAKKALL